MYLPQLEIPHVFISGHVSSFKNSKQFIRLKNGQTRLVPSKAWNKYMKNYSWQFKDYKYKKKFKSLFKEESLPLQVGFYFIRSRNQVFDFHNICAGILDLMQDHRWIDDDNIDNILPYPLLIEDKYWHKDASNPGVIITNFKTNNQWIQQLKIN